MHTAFEFVISKVKDGFLFELRFPILRLKLLFGGLFLSSSLLSLWAASLVTEDTNAVAAFHAGGEVLGFDELTGISGSGSGDTGKPIPVASQLRTNYNQLGIQFSSAGGPVGVVSVKGLSNQSDAHSPYNLIGGSASSSGSPVLDYLAPISVQFVQPGTTNTGSVDWIGAWNDPTGSRIRLTAYDVQSNVLDTVLADQGFFVGIKTNGIARADFAYVSTESVVGFTLDDVSFGPVLWKPSLAVQGSGTNALLSWPSAGLFYNLESTPALAPASIWSSVTNSPVTNLNAFMVTMPMINSSQFFRLKHR